VKTTRLVILAIVIAMLPSCGGASDAPAFNPVVSMNANISPSELIFDYTPYTIEYQAIFADGARGAQTAAPWSSLESSGPVYDLTMISNPYIGLNALAGYGFTSILVNIPIIAINARSMPADIAGLPFNDQAVKDRYRLLIDQVLPYLNSSVKYVSLGNEVDTYFSTHPLEWLQYKELIEDARTYIRSLKPNIKVGVTTTFDGATFTQAANVASLNANMDIIILTYYPTSPSFVVRSPLTVDADLAEMIAIAGNKQLVLQEWGYPTSATLSSSEQMQADFIMYTFSSWRQYGSNRIPFISFFKRRDWDAAQCTALTQGQVTGQNFFEFMCSLGLLNNNGTPKMAYSALTTELSFIGP